MQNKVATSGESEQLSFPCDEQQIKLH